MSLLDKTSMLITPNAFKAGVGYNIIGGTDLVVLRNTLANRRNSAGLIVNEINNILRIDYPITGCPVLLIEPQATNLLTHSKDYIQVPPWSNGNTVTPNFATAPDGTLTASRIQGTGFTANTYNPNNVLTDKRSIWARATTGSGNVKLMSHNSNTNNIFTLTTNWQRFILPSYSSNLANSFYAVDFRSGATINDILLWNCQAETTQVTSDIFTDSSIKTRNQDLVTVNPPAGTIKITTFFEDGSTQILTTIPTTFTLPFGRIKYVLMQNAL